MELGEMAKWLLSAITTLLLYLWTMTKFTLTHPGKSWNTIVTHFLLPRKIKDFLKKRIDILLYRVFYRKLMDRYKDDEVKLALLVSLKLHSPTIIACYWMVPGVFLILSYLGTQGCRLATTRPYMEASGMCLQLELSPRNSAPWFLKLWDDQASITHHSETSSPYIRTIMTSHLPMHNAQIALQHQAMKLQDLLPNGIEKKKLMKSLHQSMNVASNLTSQLQNFASTLCMEKDIMAAALRTFVDVYSMTITMSHVKTVKPAFFAIWPWGQPLRFLNRQWMSPLLPGPRIYNFEVEAEMRFQKERLISTINEALGMLDASSPTIRDPPQMRLLEAAIETVNTQLRKLEQTIHESETFRWPWSPKSKETLNLQECYQLLERIHDHMLTVLGITGIYEVMSSRLWNDLRPLRSTFSRSSWSAFSPTGSLVVPEPILTQVQNFSIVSLEQSSRVKKDVDGSNITEVTPNSSLLGYNFYNIDDTQLSNGRSAIAGLCKAGDIRDIPEDNLYTICTIYTLATTMSELDNNALSSQQRSWMVELEKATNSFDKQRGFDLDGVVNRLKELAGGTGESDAKVDMPYEQQ